MLVLQVALVLAVVLVVALWAIRRSRARRVVVMAVADAGDPVTAAPLDRPLPDHLAPVRSELDRLGLAPATERLVTLTRLGRTLVQVLAVDPDGRFWVEAEGSPDPEDPEPLWSVCTLLSGGRAVLVTRTTHHLPVAAAELAQTLPDASPATLVTAHRRALAMLANRAFTPELVPAHQLAQAADLAHELVTQPCRDDPAGTARRVLANQRAGRHEATGPLTQQADLGVRLAALHAR